MNDKERETSYRNPAQEEAIRSEGPTLVIAGPGTGKTYTIIQRALHLIQDEKVKPEQIMIVTYTVKVSKELMTRLTDELSRRNIEVNLHEMYIGTFHHICRRLLKEFREYTRLERSFIETDQFEQQYMVYEHLHDFEEIPGFEKVVLRSYTHGVTGAKIFFSPWKRCKKICEYVNRLEEELVHPEEMVRNGDERIRILGWMMMRYRKLAKNRNFLDFTRLQTETWYILSEKESVRKQVTGRVKYILVDEYQDSNSIQEKLVQLLGGSGRGLFVVGDDDQSIYRFRGASVSNILQFSHQFSVNCKVITLDTNYRSNQGIVTFCMKWMAAPSWFTWERGGKRYRYLKGKIHSKNSDGGVPSVVKITSRKNEKELEGKIVSFIETLKTEGCITDYNQVAILFDSVKGKRAIGLQYALYRRGIPVYAPRSGHFFERREVAWLLGCLLYLFPKVWESLKKGKELDETEGIRDKYVTFLSMAKTAMKEKSDLKEALDKEKKALSLKGTTSFSLLGLCYRILSFAPFSAIIDQAAVSESNEARNLETITRLISRFECFIEENHGHGQETAEDVEIFFSKYLRLWFENGVGEYEDEEVYAPPGRVSFLNIHQSKGLEYPVVIVASLYDYPRGEDLLIAKAVEKVTGRKSYEPYGDVRDFDFRRKYYTAFSRAETLLALACNTEKGKEPYKAFQKPLDSLPEFDDSSLSYGKLHFRSVGISGFKQHFSFTSQIALYEDCPLKYKLNRVYRFAPVRGMALLYGTLVHETIEDIHRRVLHGEEESLTPANIYAWMITDYQAMAKTENTWLSQKELDRAFQEIMGYVSYRQGNWSMVKEAEYPLEMVEDEYIISGTIDLLQTEEGKTDIIDFKTGHKPEEGSPLLAKYESQLSIYAYLVKEKMGADIGRLLLYFTGEEGDPLHEVPFTPQIISEKMRLFDRCAKQIMAGDFNHKAKWEGKEIPYPCRMCEWKRYCGRE